MEIKRVLTSFILVFAIILLGCKKPMINKISDAKEFDEIINQSGVLLYDIRLTEECSAGHIPYFMCMGPTEDKLEDYLKIANTIKNIYSDKLKVIVIIGKDEIVKQLLESLLESGYKNLYYFEGGYERYAELKGPSFVPAVGCDC